MAKRKPKSLNITSDDRVVGLQSRQKRDLFAGCNEPGKPWFQRDDYEFTRMFCRLCKNADCMRAKGAVSPWHTRMAEQVDYLLNDPNFSELSSPKHLEFAQMAFEDISQKALRLEVARVRQDWEIPDTPTDGIDKVSTPETTDQFDDAVRALAQAKGKKPPDLERPQQSGIPAHFQQVEDEPVQSEGSPSEWEYDTQYPSSDGSRTYHVTLTKKGVWACECKGFVHLEKCKHLDTVRAWYEDQLKQEEERVLQEKEAQSRPPPVRPPSDPRVPNTQYNTPMPQGGVMVGGGHSTGSGASQDSYDPWAPKKEVVVQPGAVVTFKESKKKDG